MFKQAALAGVSQVINRALAFDPATKAAIARLNGRVIEFACLQPSVSVFICVIDGDVELWGQYGAKPDTKLTGTASAFLQLLQNSQSPTALSDAGVNLSGSSEVVSELQMIIARLEFDWEALLARATGDVLAHGLGKGVRAAGGWLTRSHKELDRLISEYLQYEIETVPTAHELTQFAREVDDLRLRADRVAALIARRQSR